MIKYVSVKIKTVKAFNLEPFTKVEQFFKSKPYVSLQ